MGGAWAFDPVLSAFGPAPEVSDRSLLHNHLREIQMEFLSCFGICRLLVLSLRTLTKVKCNATALDDTIHHAEQASHLNRRMKVDRNAKDLSSSSRGRVVPCMDIRYEASSLMRASRSGALEYAKIR